MIDRVSISSGDRTSVVEYLSSKRKDNPAYTVVDVGGSASGWSAPVTDVIVDFTPPNTEERITYIQANINRESGWARVLDYVKEHGKFAFAICTHTLEDIANPSLALDMLPLIAHEGYIAVPSKHREFAHYESQSYRGHIHHRWICDVQNKVFHLFPKLSFLEYFGYLHSLENPSDSVCDLSFYWKDSIEYKLMNDDYVGPNINAVYEYYVQLLN